MLIPSNISCPYCGAIIRSDSTVCRNCQEELPKRTSSRTADPPNPQIPPQDSSPINQETYKICQFCGEKVKAQAILCKHCHKRLDGAQGSTTAAPPLPKPILPEEVNSGYVVASNKEPDHKKCPFCDKEIPSVAKRCRYCMKELPEISVSSAPVAAKKENILIRYLNLFTGNHTNTALLILGIVLVVLYLIPSAWDVYGSPKYRWGIIKDNIHEYGIWKCILVGYMSYLLYPLLAGIAIIIVSRVSLSSLGKALSLLLIGAGSFLFSSVGKIVAEGPSLAALTHLHNVGWYLILAIYLYCYIRNTGYILDKHQRYYVLLCTAAVVLYLFVPSEFNSLQWEKGKSHIGLFYYIRLYFSGNVGLEHEEEIIALSKAIMDFLYLSVIPVFVSVVRKVPKLPTPKIYVFITYCVLVLPLLEGIGTAIISHDKMLLYINTTTYLITISYITTLFTGVIMMMYNIRYDEKTTNEVVVKEEIVAENPHADVVDKLTKAKILLDKGLISKEDYDAKKNELMKKM